MDNPEPIKVKQAKQELPYYIKPITLDDTISNADDLTSEELRKAVERIEKDMNIL